MPRYLVVEYHVYSLTFDVEAPNSLAAQTLASALGADASDESEEGKTNTTVQLLPDGPTLTISEEYMDEDGMAVDLTEYLDDDENPFEHQSGPNGCPITCAACGWETLKEATEEE